MCLTNTFCRDMEAFFKDNLEHFIPFMKSSQLNPLPEALDFSCRRLNLLSFAPASKMQDVQDKAHSSPHAQRHTSNPSSRPPNHSERDAGVRRRSDSHEVPASAPEHLRACGAGFAEAAPLRTKVFHTIKDRLHKIGVRVSTLEEQELCWCLPKDGASASDWEALLTQPLNVTNPQLSRMFSLKQSESTADKPPEGSTIFYVRTFSFYVSELMHLLEHLIEKGEGSDKPYRWISELQGMGDVEDDDQTVFLRYVGMSDSKAAWKRFRDDLRIRSANPGRQGFAHRFYHACLDLYPDVIGTALIQEFSDANIQFQTDQTRNFREQTLIALFGPEFLLNSQHGGRGHRFEPNTDDEKQFRSLQTSTAQRFHSQLENVSKETHADILRYAQHVQDYANNHPQTTGAGKHTFQDALRKVMEDQCMPAFVKGRGHSILVTVGLEFSLDAYLNPVPFYTGGIGTRDLVVEILDSLAKWETTLHAEPTSVAHMAERHFLPFINLFSWAKSDDRDQAAAAGHVREYLQAAKPLVALTFGQKVSSIAVGAFHYENGIQERQLMDNVGSIFLSKYDEKSTEAADQNCIIVVPVPHPGANAYGSGFQPAFHRVLYKAISIAWLAADQVMALSSQSPPGQSTREFCRQVVRAVRQKTGSGTDWGRRLQEDKDELSKIWKTTRSWASNVRREAIEEAPTNDTKQKKLRYRTDFEAHRSALQTASVRWRFAREELAMVMACARASSAPNSSERNAQANRLVSLSLAPLQKSISEMDLWKWVKTVPTGKQYYFAMNDVDAQLEDIPNLLSIFLLEELDADKDPWKEDAAAVNEASEEVQAWIEKSIIKNFATYQDAVVHAPSVLATLMAQKQELLAKFLRDQTIEEGRAEVYTGMINGKPACILPTRKFNEATNLHLYWTESDGKVHKLEDLPVPRACTPLFPDDKRFIFFTRDGLDIRDEKGQSLGASGDRPVGIPLANLILLLQSHPLEKQFTHLWERETGLNASQILFGLGGQYLPVQCGNQKVYPENFFTDGRSRPWKAWEYTKKMSRESGIIFVSGDRAGTFYVSHRSGGGTRHPGSSPCVPPCI